MTALDFPTVLSMEGAHQRAREAIARWHDDELRRMLGMWASELEPVPVWRGHELLGLAAVEAGHLDRAAGTRPTIILEARPFNLRLTR